MSSSLQVYSATFYESGAENTGEHQQKVHGSLRARFWLRELLRSLNPVQLLTRTLATTTFLIFETLIATAKPVEPTPHHELGDASLVPNCVIFWAVFLQTSSVWTRKRSFDENLSWHESPKLETGHGYRSGSKSLQELTAMKYATNLYMTSYFDDV